MHRLCLIALFLAACGPSEKNPAPPQVATPDPVAPDPAAPGAQAVVQETTLAAVGLDPEALDRSAQPCDDFYQFACGGWLASTQIPADKSRYGRFTEIHERNEAVLHEILETARKGEGAESPVMAKIGAYYGSCMNEEAIEKAGLGGIQPLLKTARSVRNVKSLDAAVATLHQAGVPVLFELASSPDFADATVNIAFVNQGGLGLPDRDYYLDEGEKFAALRKAYQDHVADMLVLAGKSKGAARRAAAQIMKIETELAKASKSQVERRDPKGVYNPVDQAGLAKLAPSFDWKAYLAAVGTPDVAKLSVEAPKFVERLDTLRKEIKPAAWRAYLEWHVLDAFAHALPKRFVDESFEMSKALTGAEELPPRWKRCIASTDDALGELLAQPYLERMFTPEAKAAADQLVAGINAAFGEVLAATDWMSPETKAKAAQKLEKMVYLIGYPDKWRVYGWEVQPDDYAANVLASNRFEVQRDLSKVGKPYDRSEWYMSPQTVNAYYNPLANQMVFPAGILQPPFFSAEAAVPVNMGAIGMVMGHELTHGFDDSGAQFDGDGNLANWWQPADETEFQKRGECVVQQYAGFEAVPGAKLNGKLTLGENIADLGGIKLAFRAYRKLRQGADTVYVADGFTEDQQFFLSVAQAWCSKDREAEARRRVVTDPHSPPRYRVIGALQNLPTFAQAFECSEGAAMHPAQTCEVW